MNEMAGVQRFYDAAAEAFEADYYGENADPYIAYDVRRFERMLAHVIVDRRPKNAIEIGSGTGHWLAWLEERGIAATGIDVSAAMCEQARARGLTALQADAAALPIPSKTIDLILSPYCALDHCQNYEQAFAEIDRVASHNAIAVLMVDNARRLIARYWYVTLPRIRSLGSDPRADGQWLHEVDGRTVAVYTKLFTGSEMRSFLAAWHVEAVGLGFLWPLLPRRLRVLLPRRLVRLLLELLSPVEERLCRRWPNRAALAVYVATRRS